MVISGILLTPDNQPWRNQDVRITSVLTSPSVLQSTEGDLRTDANGAYTVTVPNGKYRISVLSPKSGRGYVDIGILTVDEDTPDATLNQLMMAQATVVPRDPLINEMLQIIADFEASGGGSGTGATTFTWNQTIPLTVWTIPHNMSRYPSVTVVDTSGNRVEPDVTYQSNDIVQVVHGAAFAGKAYLN